MKGLHINLLNKNLMKKLFLIFFALSTASLVDAQQITCNSSMQESLLKRSNKIYYIRTLTDSITIQKGSVVYANGKIKDAAGRTYITSDGDCIKYNGSMLMFYHTVKTVDGIKIKKSFVMIWSVLNEPVTLQNGIYATPDGKLKMLTGLCIKMKDKDFYGLNASGIMALN